MTTKSYCRPGLVAGTVLLTALTGCVAEQASQPSAVRSRPAVRVQAVVVFQDDYDYYPAYETYYSRNRREFVYRDGNAWVRRSEPRGVTLDVLFATPTVRLDFHDSPEQHHNIVVQSYPRNWVPPGQRRDDRRDESRVAQRDDGRRVQEVVVIHDDYDYYPAYETYYSRNRREYVYREGNTWVRRSEPKAVAVSVIIAAPSVRLDFHDSPEQHHSSVVRSYPKNWVPPGKAKGHDDKDEKKDDDKKDKDKKN